MMKGKRLVIVGICVGTRCDAPIMLRSTTGNGIRQVLRQM